MRPVRTTIANRSDKDIVKPCDFHNVTIEELLFEQTGESDMKGNCLNSGLRKEHFTSLKNYFMRRVILS